MGRQVEIGGMTFDSYNSDMDPSDTIGHALAEAIERERGKSCAESPYWTRLAEVALSRFPELQQGESISVREVKIRLSKIRQLGYDVEPYHCMSKEESWNYLLRIKRDIIQKARTFAPGALEMISRRNAEQRRAARDELR